MVNWRSPPGQFNCHASSGPFQMKKKWSPLVKPSLSSFAPTVLPFTTLPGFSGPRMVCPVKSAKDGAAGRRIAVKTNATKEPSLLMLHSEKDGAVSNSVDQRGRLWRSRRAPSVRAHRVHRVRQMHFELDGLQTIAQAQASRSNSAGQRNTEAMGRNSTGAVVGSSSVKGCANLGCRERLEKIREGPWCGARRRGAAGGLRRGARRVCAARAAGVVVDRPVVQRDDPRRLVGEGLQRLGIVERKHLATRAIV